MKLTRPAIAVAAAAVIAAGSVPVVHTLADGGDVAHIRPLDDTTLTMVEEAETPTETTTTEATTEASTTTSEVPPSSRSESPAPTPKEEPVEKLPSKPVDEVPTQTPPPEPAPVDPVIRTLDKAPKTYKGSDQRWFNIAQNGLYGLDGKLYKMPNGERLEVKSESMDRWIPIALFRATDGNGKIVDNAPTIYLLNGAGGSEQDTDWVNQAFPEMVQTFAGQSVNVVVPMEGAFSYYVDWAAEPPVTNSFYKGKQMWSTFLAHELPAAVEGYTNANDKRAVAGLSMAATSTLLLAEHNPGFYDAVGSFSGCAATSTPIPNFFIGLTVDRGASGKMTPEHIFGPMGSDYNRYNDALVNAEKLRGTKLYISTGTGLAGETDMPGYLAKRLQDSNLQKESAEAHFQGSANAFTLQVEGGAIEGAMNACTHDLRAKLNGLGIPADYELRNVGTHSWPVWKDDLKLSYDRVFKEALGLK